MINYSHLTLDELVNLAAVEAKTDLEKSLLNKMNEYQDEVDGRAETVYWMEAKMSEYEAEKAALKEALEDAREQLKRCHHELESLKAEKQKLLEISVAQNAQILELQKS